MTKFEELEAKINNEIKKTFKKTIENVIMTGSLKDNTNLFLKLEMAHFLHRNKDCLSNELIEKLLERDRPLSDMVFTLHDYVFVDGILMEVFDDAFTNGEENRDYIREWTYGEDEDYEEEDEYDDYADEDDDESEEDEDDEDGEEIDTLDDLDCDREDLNSYSEYLNEHDEGFIHDNEDC